MELFTYLMAKNDHNTSVKKDLFSYLLGKNQSGTYQEYTGTSLSISNTKKGKMKVDLYGNTSQVSLSGKNLASLETTGTSIGGVSFTKENGVIHINGTTNSSVSFNFNSFQTSSGTATYWIEVTGYTDKPSGNSSMVLQQSTDNSTWSTFKDLSLSSIYSKQDTVTLDSSKYYRIRWYTENNTFTNATIKVQLEMGSSKTSFEPYTGGTASPNPDYPQRVEIVSGDNTIKVCGKNLFNLTPYSDRGITFEENSDGTIKIYGTATTTYCSVPSDKRTSCNLEPGTYTYSRTEETPVRVGLSVWYEDGTTENIAITSGTSVTFTKTKKIVQYGPYLSNMTANTSYSYNIGIQLETGSTASTYEPYTSASYPIHLGEYELCKIGTYQDYFYKDNGNWYLHKEIGKVVLDGSENWYVAKTGTVNWYYELENINISIIRNSDASNTKCSHFQLVEISNNNTLQGLFIISNGRTRIRTASEDTAPNFKTWLSNNNVSIYYVLATPTYTKITDTTLINQLEAVYNAKSYKDQTNINQVNDDLPFELKVKVKVSS